MVMVITETKTATLEEVTATLAERRSKVAGLQRELEAATQEGAGLKNLREKFLVMASTGDEAATRQVLEIESKQLTIGRKVEGLELRRQTAQRELQEVEAEWKQLAQRAAIAERDRRTEELTREAVRLAHNRNALWRTANRAAFDEAEFHFRVVRASGLSEQQQAQIRKAGLDVYGQRTGGVEWNEKWESTSAFTAPLTITPTKAPDELRHLEELK